jgi:hypothetical protein
LSWWNMGSSKWRQPLRMGGNMAWYSNRGDGVEHERELDEHLCLFESTSGRR